MSNMRAWLEKNGYRLVALLIEIVSALAAIGFAGPARILFLAVALLSALAGVVLFWTAEQDPSELLTLTPRPPLHKHTRSARCIVVIAFVLGVLLLVFVATPSIKSAVTGPEPTPLAGKPAAEDEILVVVAEFEKSSGAEYEPHIDMLEVLEQAAEEVGNVRVIALNQTIQDREEAQRISDVYNATMVVYGRVAPGGVTARYEISPRFNKFCCVESQEFRVSSAEIENFEAFLYEGMDLNYILGLTLGQLYYYDKQYEKAIDAFSRAADSLADERREQLKANILFIYRGDAYVEQGLFDQAIKDYGKALEVDSRDANAYNNRGTAYANQGEYQKSIEDFERAIQFAPNDPVSYFNLGVTFVKLGENDKALSLFSQTIRVDPLFYKAYFNRGVLLDVSVHVVSSNAKWARCL
jgi:tetratricopeptide (TPR) repeat protein